MRRHAASLWAGALLALLFLSGPPPARADSRAAAIVTAVPREVFYQRGGVGPLLPLRLHALLYPGDVVQSGPDGAAELLFTADGSSVKMDAGTTLRITAGALHHHKDNLFQAILGVIWAHLRPGADVEAPGQTNIVTHGTEILLSVTAAGATTLTVVEGDVSFSNPQGARELTTAQQSVALPGQAPTLPAAVDVSGLIAWTFNVAALPLEFELPAPRPSAPGDPVAALVQSGQARRGLGDLPGALDAFGQALRLDGGSEEARVGLALTYLSQGQPAQARAALEPARGRPTALAALGLTDLHQGRGADAERDLRAALALDPHQSTASALLALALLSRDDLPDALAASQQAVAERPDSAQAQGTRAMVLFFAGQTGAAEAASRRAVRLNPLSPFALLTEGRALLARRQADAARAAYEKAASLAPDLWLAHQELGAAYQQLDMPRKADEEYRAALALDPDSADSHTGLGLSLQGQGRYAEAEREHRRAVALDPSDATARYNLAALLIDRGRLDEARQELEVGVRAAPERGVLYARLAEISLYRQDLFGAQEFARRAVGLLPDSALAHYELGRVYLEQEHTIQAEQEFRQATTLDRQFAAARYALGLTQEKTEAGLITSFSSLLDSAFVGSPGSGRDITNLQTPGAEQRIQAALLDPTVVRSASRAYGDTQLSVTLGQQDSRDLAGSYLTETPDRRGVRGVNGEEQYANGVRTNADSKIDTASIIAGQRAAAGPAGFLALGEYEETESGSDTGTLSDPYYATQRYHTQLPRLTAGVNLQFGGRGRLLALVQGSEARYMRHILMQPDDYDHLDTRSVDGELRWEKSVSEVDELTAGFSYGDRHRRVDHSQPASDPTMPPDRVVLTTNVQPYQVYVRDDRQAGRRWLLTGQVQILGLNPLQRSDVLGIDNHQRTTVVLPTAIVTYASDARSTVRLRARRLFATVRDFQLLTPTDVFLLSTAGLPQPEDLFPLADGTSVEAEYDHTFENASFFSVGVFQQDLRRAGVTDSAVSAGPYDAVRIQALQTSYQGLLGRDLSFFLSAALNRSRDTAQHDRAAQVPDYLGVATLQYLNRQGYYGQTAYYYQGGRRYEDTDINGNYDPTRLGGFGILNVRFGKRVGLRANVYVELNNAFNRQYDDLGTLLPGRLFSVGATARF